MICLSLLYDSLELLVSSHPEAVFLATVIHLDRNLLTVMKVDNAIANQVLEGKNVTAVLMGFMDLKKEDALVCIKSVFI